MTRERLTDKRMANRRFRRTEDAILRAFFEGDNYISVEEMAKRAGMARSTFYFHHQAVSTIIVDYRKFIMRKYSRKVRNLLNKKVELDVIYNTMLYFIIRYKSIFNVLVQGKDRIIYEEMIDCLREKIVKAYRLPKHNALIFRVYRSEIVEILVEWGEGGFSEETVREVLNNIIHLTETIRVRLRDLQSDS